ncbi:MAG: ribosome recycling factor [Cyanobacteriota bacterium]|jgi:ribosome recycling factor|nr:ribosome recycling factor [Cyanobacteriota bacterium]
MSADDVLLETEDQMQKAIEATQRNFNTIRTGRANASLLDRIEIEYYGTQTPLKAVANISTPDASTLMIQPFDAKTLTTIEKAISLSDVGLTPNNDGRVIRLNIPALTTQRRQEFVKTAHKLAEEGRVSIRNQRRQGIDGIKKLEKASEISEDEARDLQEEIQKLTDRYIAKLDQALAAKEKDITTV